MSALQAFWAQLTVLCNSRLLHINDGWSSWLFWSLAGGRASDQPNVLWPMRWCCVDGVTWSLQSFLCNVVMGECIVKVVIELDPGNAAGYVLLQTFRMMLLLLASGISLQVFNYSWRGWREHQPGYICLEVNNEVQIFVVHDEDYILNWLKPEWEHNRVSRLMENTIV